MATQHRYDNQKDDLFVSIHPQLRKRIMMAAAQSNLSIEDYVNQILEQSLPDETHSVQESDGRLNRTAVDRLLQTREAIMRAHPGLVFEDSAETLRQIREERMRELEQR